MKKKIFIIGGCLLAVIVAAVCIIAAMPKDKPSDDTNPTESSSAEVSVPVITPDDPEETTGNSDVTAPENTEAPITPIVDDPVDEDRLVSPTEPEQTNGGEVAPAVIGDVVQSTDKEDVTSAQNTGKTETGVKDQSTDKGIDADGDVINDRIEEKKQEAIKQQEEKDDKEHPTVVLDEKTVSDDTKKPDVIVGEDKPDDGQTQDSKTSGAEYVPQSGDHPFEAPVDGGGGQTYNVDDIVGDDGDKPGEGIHF